MLNIELSRLRGKGDNLNAFGNGRQKLSTRYNYVLTKDQKRLTVDLRGLGTKNIEYLLSVGQMIWLSEFKLPMKRGDAILSITSCVILR